MFLRVKKLEYFLSCHQTKLIKGLFKPVTGKGDEIIMSVLEKSGPNLATKLYWYYLLGLGELDGGESVIVITTVIFIIHLYY